MQAMWVQHMEHPKVHLVLEAQFSPPAHGWCLFEDGHIGVGEGLHGDGVQKKHR